MVVVPLAQMNLAFHSQRTVESSLMTYPMKVGMRKRLPINLRVNWPSRGNSLGVLDEALRRRMPVDNLRMSVVNGRV